MRRLLGLAVLTVLLCGGIGSAVGYAQEFPFDRELVLDAPPMSGSKRLPGLEVTGNGAATIDLWCNSGPGQVVVAGDTVTVIAGRMSTQQCPPERMRANEDLLAALSEVTTWHRDGDVLVLVGPHTLRYRPMTN